MKIHDHRVSFLNFIIIVIFFILSSSMVLAKPFQRALIISGGGMMPGLGLGYIQGLQNMGWQPDVIIATCGASIPTIVYDWYANPSMGLDYLKSGDFFNVISQTKVHTHNLITLRKKFQNLRQNPGLIPDFFTDYALDVSTSISSLFAKNGFEYKANQPRVILTAARALFQKKHVGLKKSQYLKFREILFTDPVTKLLLKNYKSDIKKKYPDSFLEWDTETISDVSYEVAARGAIADPFLMEPLKYKGEYYFTGAVDLYPIELAKRLAEEIVVTYPMSRLTDYEDLAIQSTFGFSQRKRALEISQDTSIIWIDQTNLPKEMTFDPQPSLIWLIGRVPDDIESFQKTIDLQYKYGNSRAQEAIELSRMYGPQLNHIRHPLTQDSLPQRLDKKKRIERLE